MKPENVLLSIFISIGAVVGIGACAGAQINKERSAKMDALPNAEPAVRLDGAAVSHTVVTLPSGERFFVVSNYRGIACSQIQTAK